MTMKSTFFFLLIMGWALCGACQKTATSYYADARLSQEVSQSQAKFMQTITTKLDQTVVTEVVDLLTQQLVSSTTYKGKEPFGIWKLPSRTSPKTLDFDFELLYDAEKCANSPELLRVSDYFQNDTLNGYVAPKLESGGTVMQFVAKQIVYAAIARENGIAGRVYLKMLIDSNGAVSNISIIKGVHVLLDKEAARVLRLLKFSSPARLQGAAVPICVTMPIAFRLE